MNSRVRALFPTLLYVAPLRRGGSGDLNRRLLAETTGRIDGETHARAPARTARHAPPP